MHRGRALIVAVGVVLAVMAAAAASALPDSGRRVGSAGVSVQLPQGWRSIPLALPPGLRVDADPVARVVVSSGPVSFGAGCGAVPYAFPRTAVALVIMERLRPTRGVFAKRPARFTSRTLPVRAPPAVECFDGPAGGVEFADHGRRFEVFLLLGRAAPASLADRARLVLDTLTVTPKRPRTVRVGRSVQGRAIVAIRVGNPHGRRVLVVGCVHGNECAGVAIIHALEHAHTSADLWLVPDLNPDGHAHGTRQNADGVDLNANWSFGWRQDGRPWDFSYGGPAPFSERETRIARNLIERLHPQVTIWYHQHMNLVWAWGPSTAAGRRYARLSGMRFYHHPWLAGTAANWQNHHDSRAASFTVELPAGALTPVQVAKHARAVLALGPG